MYDRQLLPSESYKQLARSIEQTYFSAPAHYDYYVRMHACLVARLLISRSSVFKPASSLSLYLSMSMLLQLLLLVV